MNVQLSIYRNATRDKTGVGVSFDAVVARIKDGKRGLDEKTKDCNLLYQTEPDKYKKLKETLPAVTWSGKFSKRGSQHLIQHSGFVVLDIDDTLDLGSVFADFANTPHVRFAFVSPSGQGVKPVIPVYPIPSTADEHKAAFYAVLEVFDKYVVRDPKMLPAQSNVDRLCFLTHDPRPLENPNAIPVEWDREAWETYQAEQEKHRTELESRDWSGYEKDLTALDFISNDCDYETWRNVGMAIKSAGLSVSVFKKWTGGQRKRSTGEWVTEDIDAHWGSYNSTGITWGTVVFLAMQNGYELPQRPQKAKRQRTADAPASATETLDDNRDKRDTATATFMVDTPESQETIHILLVRDPTGGGKSDGTTRLAKAHGKRTIAQTPHTELARQAVEIARKYGFKNPFHLLGREHNWHDSGIAEIPIEARTRELFDKNNCIMVDAVKTYTDKRLAPRTHCEHRCTFRDGCPHLAQYEGLGERDFIASCTPNLLFDINFRGYLKSLVTATHEASDEELAIDALLGTESKDVEAFDLAIIDDYGINGLYTDVTFTESEFKALKKAWTGTPTGAFAKLVLKAFQKENPKRIIKALRTAYESTAEHHEEISQTLTQHAREGIIEYATQAKGSKESRRLLAEKVVTYNDGGQEYIPVDFEAYKELTEKGIPTIHPQKLDTDTRGEQVRIPHAPTRALIAGVPVRKLTPIWQTGATPIELLDIFLASLGNDKNAPINRTFIASDPPVPVLTFSIPPQAPVGIIPQIAMLSATTDTEATQRTFDGQAVTFSEHTGAGLDWAEGVQVYQFQDGRLTSSSVFEYQTDTDGHRKLQEAPTGLKPTAEKRLQKLNEWARDTDGLTAFISYKEFTEHLTAANNGFDIVTHFDKVAGLNFEGLKFLVVFGYPKVKHEVVMEHAHKQYAGDSQPLPAGSYEDLTEEHTHTEHGITSTERTYKDPRLETIRHQLATEKLEQAIGRARLPVWEHTTTLIFTAAPVPCTTERATLYSSAAFNLAEAPNDLASAMERIEQAEDSGDVQAVMETKGVSQRTAERNTKDTRDQQKADRDARIIELHQEGKSQREIERMLKNEGHKYTSRKAISPVVQKRQAQLELLIGDGANAPHDYEDTLTD